MSLRRRTGKAHGLSSAPPLGAKPSRLRLVRRKAPYGSFAPPARTGPLALCSLHQNPSGFGAKGAFTGAPYGSTGECDRRTAGVLLCSTPAVLHAPKAYGFWR